MILDVNSISGAVMTDPHTVRVGVVRGWRWGESGMDGPTNASSVLCGPRDDLL